MNLHADVCVCVCVCVFFFPRLAQKEEDKRQAAEQKRRERLQQARQWQW